MCDERHTSPWSRRRYLQTTATAGIATVAGLSGSGTASAEPGDVRWQFESDSLLGSPTVVDGTVYVASREKLRALDAASGRKQWVTGSADSIAPVTVADGTVYVSPKLRAIDARIGSKQWSIDLDHLYHYSSPMVADGTVFVGSGDGRLYAVDAGTGEKVWQFETGDEEWSPAVVVDGTVYIQGGSEPVTDDGTLIGHRTRLYAVDARTGETLWSVETYGKPLSTPTLRNGTVFVCSGAPDSTLYALDSETGDEVWAFEVDRLGQSTPTVANGTVYVGSNKAVYGDSRHGVILYAVDAASGEEMWTVDGEGYVGRGSPTVAGGSVFIASIAGVYAADAVTGEIEWQFENGDDFSDSFPIVVDGVLYINSSDLDGTPSSVYALEAGVDGSSEGSRAWLGTQGHHDEWAHAGQQIQIHREGTYSSMGPVEFGLLGGTGLAAGGLFGIRQLFKTRLGPDRSDET